MIRFLCVLCVLCGSSFSAFALDRHAFTFTHYGLDVRIEPEQQRLGVRGKITLRNDSDAPQKSLALQISSSLNWLSIQLKGKPVEFVSQSYTSDIDHTGALTEAIVVLPSAVAPKESIELEVGYEGTIPQDATRLTRIGVPADTAKHSDWDQIGRTFTAVRGIGYVAWYPIATEAVSLSEGSSVSEEVGRWKQREAQALLDVYVCGTKKLSDPLFREIMNDPDRGQGHGGTTVGVPEHSKPEDLNVESCSDHRFSPLGPWVPTFVLGDYSKSQSIGAVVHYLSGQRPAAEHYGLAVEQVAPLVSKWFGDHRDTPATKAEIVDLPDPEAEPFESGNMLLMPLTANETTILLSAARQMTHLYFPSPRTWISDGLSAFAQANYIREEKGPAAALVYLESHRGALVQAEKANPTGKENRRNETSLINSVDEFYVQAKAMNVWWMLRDIIGENAFTAALHNYKATDDNDPHYIQKLIEAQFHRDLNWFFDDWVYNDRGLPNLRIASVHASNVESGSFLTAVTVENLGDAGAEVPVIAHMAKGDSTERLTVPAKSKASIRIVTPALPQEIKVNDGSVPESETTTHVYKIEH